MTENLDAGICSCGTPRMIRASGWGGKPENRGRKFSTCPKCKKWGRWMDETKKQRIMPHLELRPVISGHLKPKTVIDLDGDPVESKTTDPTGLTPLSTPAEITVEQEPTSPIKKSFIPSPYNEEIRDAFQNSDRHIEVKARAGSGKTSNNVWLCSFIKPRSVNLEMLVFGKANQLEMQERVPEWMRDRTRTSHAFGFDLVCKHYGIKSKFEYADRSKGKTWTLFREHFENNWDVRDNYQAIAKLLSLSKNTLREPNRSNLDYLCERFDVETNDSTDLIYDAVAVMWKLSIERLPQLCEMDDMLFAPAYGLVPVEKRDLLIVDEYQDNNDAQRALYLKTGARILYVGDEFQSIFGFRGAMLDAMPAMQRELEALSFPLPISYRCAKSIITLAQTIVPDIQPRPDAPDGLVGHCADLRLVKPGDMVLCRNNAPLVKPCFELIRSGVKATIKGRDIGTNLMNLVKKVEKKRLTFSFSALLSAIQDYTNRESSKLDMQHKESQAASLRDQCETIMALSDDCNSTGDLERKVKTIFSDDVAGVVFSTIHKAKGLESDHVFVLKPELLAPQKYDTRDWQLSQLRNLTYVCYTRARQELRFVQGGEK